MSEEETDFNQPPSAVAQSFDTRPKNGDLASSTGEVEVKVGDTQREYYCGCGAWHPPQLQVFRDARVFTFLLCLFATIEGALVSGFTSVVLSTLERRYGLSSTSTGAIASTFEASVLVSVVFISYFGGRGHKPRWLGVGLIIQAIGSFIFSLPQFVFGPYRVGPTGSFGKETCLDGHDFSDCTSSTNAALVFFIIGNILVGLGAAPLFTVGTSYLDEIVRPRHVSIHLGVFYMTSIVGPALGYALGGAFLSIYVDPWRDTHLETSDPGWVGAWWLCFIFCGVVSLIIAVPFFCYPRLLPDSEQVKKEREQEMAKRCVARTEVDREKLKTALKEFLLEVKRIVTNPAWVFMTVALTTSILIVSGFASFGPKYVETQFGLPSSVASLAVGAVAIPSGGAGVVVGGLIIYFLKAKGHQIPLVQLAMGVVAILPLLALLISCPTSQIAGITAAYPDGTSDLPNTEALNSSCITDCNCTSSVYEPVCGADDIVYFSPCRAGCPVLNTTEADFEQCSCVADRLSASSANSSYTAVLAANSTATDGLCDRNCGVKLGFFLLLIGVGLFFVFMLQIPNVLVTIRCVAEDQRTLALGVQSFFWRAFGSIPGPLLFGVIFDSSCLFWQQQCGRRGNCWVYNNTSLSVRAVVLAVSAMAAYCLFIFICWLVYPRPRGGDHGQTKEDVNGDTLRDNTEVVEGPPDGVEEERGGGEEEGGGGEGEEEGGGGEGEEEGGEEEDTSVIRKMQTRNSTAQLLELDDIVGSNRSSPLPTDS